MDLELPADTTVLPSIVPGPALGGVVAGIPTDVVTVLYADATLALDEWPLASISADGSTMVVDARTSIDGPSGLQPGDLVWFTNAVGNALQQVTAVAGQAVTFDSGADDLFGLNQRGAPQGTILQIRAGATFPPTSATRVTMVTYFVEPGPAGAAPRLFRRVNLGPARLVAVGVENLQVSYDLVDGAANPTNQKAPVAPNTAQEIRKVNLFLAARSARRVAPTTQPFRASAATAVSLRSMSYVDRYR